MRQLEKRKQRYRAFVLSAALGVMFALLPSVKALAAEPGWVRQENGWYYYLEDGTPAKGWVDSNGSSYYILEGGKMFADGLTPDGYYVDQNGAWYQRKEKLLGRDFTAPVRALSLGEEWPGKESLTGLKTVVNQGFSGNRSLKVTDNAVEYVLLEPQEDSKSSGNSSGSGSTGSMSSGSSGRTGDYSGVVTRDNVDAIRNGILQNSPVSQKNMKETPLLGLYREPAQGRYRLDIYIGLDEEENGAIRSSAYDYGVFRAMAFQISSVPEILADGIYSAWEEDNRWGISRQKWVQVGDCLVLYTSGNGYGRFYISPLERGN